jgi:hypothetical protein
VDPVGTEPGCLKLFPWKIVVRAKGNVEIEKAYVYSRMGVRLTISDLGSPTKGKGRPAARTE